MAFRWIPGGRGWTGVRRSKSFFIFLNSENGDPQHVSLSTDTCELHSQGVEAGADRLELDLEVSAAEARL